MAKYKMPSAASKEAYKKYRENGGANRATYERAYKPSMKSNECCFKCKYSAGGCSWSDNLIPVEGSVTLETPLQTMRLDDFRKILFCPQYDPGDAIGVEWNEDNVTELFKAYFAEVRKEYIHILRRAKEAKKDYERAQGDRAKNRALEVLIDCRERKQRIEEGLPPKYLAALLQGVGNV